MAPYTAIYTKSYERCVKKYKSRVGRIRDLEQRVLAHPLAAPPMSHRLDLKDGVDLRGKRRRVDGDGTFVLLYMVCEECLELEFQGYNDCAGCDDIPREAVIFLGYGPHDHMYAKEWQAVVQ